MAAKKTPVVFIKRVEDRDKSTGKKIVIKAGSRAELTNAELKKLKDCVRPLEDLDSGKRPVLAAPTQPPAGGTGDDDDDDEEDEGAGGGDNGGTGA